MSRSYKDVPLAPLLHITLYMELARRGVEVGPAGISSAHSNIDNRFIQTLRILGRGQRSRSDRGT